MGVGVSYGFVSGRNERGKSVGRGKKVRGRK
jgi:hypothetical protein